MKKRLIVCCDGTWNDLEMRYITNVGRLAQALLPEAKRGNQKIPQIIYYDDGVGAAAEGLRRLKEGGTGEGLDLILYEAYRFLCVNYEEGDEICLFGFSRGAFTARSLAGMIGQVGLVPRSQLKHVPGALDAYRSRNVGTRSAFRRLSQSNVAEITLLGCWDTVGALGIPDKTSLLSFDKINRKKYRFHDLSLGSNVKIALHAVAIDEERKEFAASLMHRGTRRGQVLVQKWFPGDHCCVGGGLWEKRGLSNHCLRWMVDEARRQGLNLAHDWTYLHDEAIADTSIYFDNSIARIYSYKRRPIRRGVVRFGDFDESVIRRWAEDPNYRPKNLALDWKTNLEAAAGSARNVRVPATIDKRLRARQSAQVQVFSENSNNKTNIYVQKGERYEIEIERAQVWKDGNFDPCDIAGWNTIEQGQKSKLPYEDGEKVDPSALTASITRFARKKRLVQNADWFQFVVGIDGEDFVAPVTRRPAEETEPWKLQFAAVKDGRLSFAANDLISRIDLVDKYDNNAGWVWTKVTRVA